MVTMVTTVDISTDSLTTLLLLPHLMLTLTMGQCHPRLTMDNFRQHILTITIIKASHGHL